MHLSRVTSLLILAGLSHLSGCADSATSVEVASDPPRSSVKSSQVVVVANHHETITTSQRTVVRGQSPAWSPPQSSEASTRRLPLPYPSTAPTPTLARLPRVTPSPSTSARTYPIDLTQTPRPGAAPAMSLVPPIVTPTSDDKETEPASLVPQKRNLAAKPAKPLLPSLSQRVSAGTPPHPAWLAVGAPFLAVSQRADAIVDQGFSLAEKGAFYSARTEFHQALRSVAQALDAHYGGNHHSAALAAGWNALTEADDFSVHGPRGTVVAVASLVDAHQTELLKPYALDDVSPVVAMQYYFVYAQEQLVVASGQAPVAARAMYGLGKTHMVLSEKTPTAARLHAPKAMAFHQAAVITDPTNYLAANELGVLLARSGKLEAARHVLQHSVGIYPLPETWQNLSVVHQRLGETQYAMQAMERWQLANQSRLQSGAQAAPSSNHLVEWVPPQAFIVGQTDLPSATQPQIAPLQPIEQAQKPARFRWW